MAAAQGAGRDAAEAAVLVLHGYENHRPEGHWQHWLARELESRGVLVAYPQLPEPDAPVPRDWLDAIAAALDGLLRDGARAITVVAHSLACVAWLRFAAEARAAGLTRIADRVLLVAPPSNELLADDPALAPFVFPVPPGPRGAEAAGAREALVVASDADPYNARGAAATWAAPLGLPLETVPGAGHLTIPDGYGPWPAVLAWCLGEGGFEAGAPAQ